MISRPDDSSEPSYGPKRGVIPLLVLVALVVVFFRPVLLTGRIMMLKDLCFLFYPGYVFLRESVFQGSVPLWNPYLGCGEPFLADIQRGALYPPNVLYLLVPTGQATVLSASFHVLLAGVGAYGLSRVWRVSRMASLLAAVSYAFSSYTITKMEFPTELGSAAWFPVVMAAFAHWVERRSRRALALVSGALCLQFLTGFPETLTFTIAALGLYALMTGFHDWRTQRRWTALFAPIVGLGVAGILSLLLSMVQFLPTWEALQASARSVEFEPRLDKTSLPPLAMFSLLVPSVYGAGGGLPTYWSPTCSAYCTGAFYIGVAPLVVFLTVAIHRLVGLRVTGGRDERPADRRAVRVPFLLTLMACFYLYALGKHTPFYGFWRDTVPLLRHFVSPPKCLLCVVLSLGCLAAIAMDDLVRTGRRRLEVPQRWRRLLLRWGPLIVALGVGAFMVACLLDGGQLGKAVLTRYFNFGAVEPRFAHKVPWGLLGIDSVKLAFVGVVAAGLLQAVAFRPRGRTVASWFILLITFADLLVTNGYLLKPVPTDVLEHRPAHVDRLRPAEGLRRYFALEYVYQIEVQDMAAMLPTGNRVEAMEGTEIADLARVGWYRVDRTLRDASYKSWPMVDKVFNVYTANNFPSRDTARIMDVILKTGAPPAMKRRLLAMLNCDRIVLPPDPRRIVAEGKWGPIRLTMLDEPLPRAYVVGGMAILPDEDAVLAALLAMPFDPWEMALIDEESAGGDTFDDLSPGRVVHEVRRMDYGPSAIEMDVWCKSPGMLVMSEAHYPGWTAKLNGEEVKLYKVNRAFRGVRVSAGTNTVRMVYQPTSLRIGAIVSLVTLFLLAVVLLLPRSKAGPSASELLT